MHEVIKLHTCSIDTLLQMDIWDQRLLNCALLGKDQGFLWQQKRVHPVDLGKYSELSGLVGRPSIVYDRALASARKLRDAEVLVTLPNDTKLYTSIVYDILATEASLSIYWNKNFLPIVSGMMDTASFMFPRVAMAGVSSSKRYALYLLIEKNLWRLAKSGTFSLDKEEIKEVAQIEGSSYDKWSAVTRRVINPTLESIYNILGIELIVKTGRSEVEFSLKEALI